MRYYMRLVAFVDGLVATVVALAMILRSYPDAWGIEEKASIAARALIGEEGAAGPYLALGGTVLLILNAVAFSRRVFGLNRTKDLPLSEGSGDSRIRTAAVEDLLAGSANRPRRRRRRPAHTRLGAYASSARDGRPQELHRCGPPARPDPGAAPRDPA